MARTFETLAGQFERTGGRPSGFDYLRICLALSVVGLHSVLSTRGISADVHMWETPLRPLLRAVLPMFFALSGFLVAGSLERCRSLISFLGLRIIRIYPALAVEVCLSAVIIGPAVTRVDLGDYLRSPVFHRYFLNALGDIHYALPGVFTTNPVAGVNVQLWTVPFELGCYLSLAMVAIMGALRRPVLVPLSAAALALAYLAGRLIKHHGESGAVVGALPGVLLIVSFLLGVAAYLYRAALPFSRTLAVAGGVLGAVCLNGLAGNLGDVICLPMLTYLTVYIGLNNPRQLWLLRGADYSYGVFLYGFVIQQLVSFAFPALRFWWLNLLISVPIAIAFAAMSWHLVEKPALKLRGPLLKLELRLLGAFGTAHPWPKAAPPVGARARELS